MVRMCAGKMLPKGDPNKFYLLRSLGNSAHEIWDVTAPETPTLLKTVVTGIKDTHKNFWECDTGIAYLVSGAEGWKIRRMMQVFDLADPANPRHIRDFGLVGQEPAAPESKEARRFDLHGAIRAGNRLYVGYGTFLDGVIQILDREKLIRGNPAVQNPLAPTPENLTYPEVTRLFTSPRKGAHMTFPVLGIDVPEFARNSEGKTRDILRTSMRGSARSIFAIPGRQRRSGTTFRQ
ncbi:MAG: LVIVD repeat-containing protein [Burkholderiales bacterium]